MKKHKKDVLTVLPVDKQLIGGLYKNLQRSKVLPRLAELKIPFPAQLDPVDTLHQFPQDVTQLDNDEIRRLVSYWTSQMARANAILGLVRAERKKLERRVDRASKIRFSELSRTNGARKPLVDDLRGRVLRDRNIGILEKKLDESIQMEEALEPLVKDFIKYTDILSGELMYRMAEMKTFRNT